MARVPYPRQTPDLSAKNIDILEYLKTKLTDTSIGADVFIYKLLPTSKDNLPLINLIIKSGEAYPPQNKRGEVVNVYYQERKVDVEIWSKGLSFEEDDSNNILQSLDDLQDNILNVFLNEMWNLNNLVSRFDYYGWDDSVIDTKTDTILIKRTLRFVALSEEGTRSNGQYPLD